MATVSLNFWPPQKRQLQPDSAHRTRVAAQRRTGLNWRQHDETRSCAKSPVCRRCALIALEAARLYSAANLAIYPVDDKKRALIKRWNYEGALRDPDRIEAIFRQFPDAGVGIACGPSEHVVIDVDERNGGNESFRKLCAEVGLESFELCPTVRTPSGGFHYHFQAGNERIRTMSHALGPGIDVIGYRGGVVAPPSRRAAGAYVWHCEGDWPDTLEAPPLPDAIRSQIRARTAARRVQRLAATTIPPIVEQGERNQTLALVAIRLRTRLGLGRDSMMTALTSVNVERCRPPLSERELTEIVMSAIKYPVAGVDPLSWLDGWLSELTNPTELRVATTLATLADCVIGDLSPNAELMARRCGLAEPHYYAARKRLEDLKAIVVHRRGRKLAPVIELRLRLPPQPPLPRGTDSVAHHCGKSYVRI